MKIRLFAQTNTKKDTVEISDEKVKIPMQGKIESLNVSSSSAVILYELIRQRN